MSEEIKEVEETEESKEIKEDDGTYSYEERRAAMARNNKAEMMDGVKEFGLGILALAGFMLYYVLLLGFISFIMIDAWAPHYIQLLTYAGCLAIVTEILYIVIRVRKKKKERALKRYLEE